MNLVNFPLQFGKKKKNPANSSRVENKQTNKTMLWQENIKHGKKPFELLRGRQG